MELRKTNLPQLLHLTFSIIFTNFASPQSKNPKPQETPLLFVNPTPPFGLPQENDLHHGVDHDR